MENNANQQTSNPTKHTFVVMIRGLGLAPKFPTWPTWIMASDIGCKLILSFDLNALKLIIDEVHCQAPCIPPTDPWVLHLMCWIVAQCLRGANVVNWVGTGSELRGLMLIEAFMTSPCFQTCSLPISEIKPIANKQASHHIWFLIIWSQPI